MHIVWNCFYEFSLKDIYWFFCDGLYLEWLLSQHTHSPVYIWNKIMKGLHYLPKEFPTLKYSFSWFPPFLHVIIFCVLVAMQIQIIKQVFFKCLAYYMILPTDKDDFPFLTGMVMTGYLPGMHCSSEDEWCHNWMKHERRNELEATSFVSILLIWRVKLNALHSTWKILPACAWIRITEL